MKKAGAFHATYGEFLEEREKYEIKKWYSAEYEYQVRRELNSKFSSDVRFRFHFRFLIRNSTATSCIFIMHALVNAHLHSCSGTFRLQFSSEYASE